MTVHLKLQQKNLDFLWLENKRNKFNKNHIVQGGGETGSMYVLSYEVRWYVHIIYNSMVRAHTKVCSVCLVREHT